MPARDRLEKVHQAFVRINIGVAPSEAPESQLHPGKDPMYYTTTAKASNRWMKMLKKRAQKIPGFICLSPNYVAVKDGRLHHVDLVVTTRNAQVEEFLANLPKNW